MLDITNPSAVAWLQIRLTMLQAVTGDDVVFYRDTGNTFHTPHHFSFAQPLVNPDLYKEQFDAARPWSR